MSPTEVVKKLTDYLDGDFDVEDYEIQNDTDVLVFWEDGDITTISVQ